MFWCLQRMDLGECIKVHDLALRADYEIASKEQEYFFELDVSFTHFIMYFFFCFLKSICLVMRHLFGVDKATTQKVIKPRNLYF